MSARLSSVRLLAKCESAFHCCSRGRRRDNLEQWFQEGVQRLHRVPFDAQTGMRWARLLAKLRRTGRAMPIKDSQGAATALTHQLVLATRNVSDFWMSKALMLLLQHALGLGPSSRDGQRAQLFLSSIGRIHRIKGEGD